MAVRSVRNWVSHDGEYYSIPRTKAQIVAAGLECASHIPDRFNRQKKELRESSMFSYVMKCRNEVKTPYEPGDEVAYLVNENVGTKKFPDIIRSVRFDTVYKITPKTIQFGNGRYVGRNTHKEYVIGRIKKE